MQSAETLRGVEGGYTADEHRRWGLLYSQTLKTPGLSRTYLEGRDAIGFAPHYLEPLAAISRRLEAIAGWSLVPVNGLIAPASVFRLLVERRFPISIGMRGPDELRFAKLPDVFHDLVGHVPMLASGSLSSFLIEFGRVALGHLDDPVALAWLQRYFWYTFETGLVREHGEIRVYGGAVITSQTEAANATGPNGPRQPFNVERMLAIDYDNLQLQVKYFVLESWSELVEGLHELRARLAGQRSDLEVSCYCNPNRSHPSAGVCLQTKAESNHGKNRKNRRQSQIHHAKAQ